MSRVCVSARSREGVGDVEGTGGLSDVIFDSKSTSSFTHQTVTPRARMFKRAHICIITSHNKQEARTASIHPHLNTSVCCFNRPCGLASHHTSAATHHCPTPGRRQVLVGRPKRTSHFTLRCGHAQVLPAGSLKLLVGGVLGDLVRRPSNNSTPTMFRRIDFSTP